MIHRDEIVHFWIFYRETHFFQIQMLIATLFFKNRTKATPFQNNMDDRTPEEIYKLPISSAEKFHPSRKCTGYHVFLSQFFFEFRGLPIEDQLEYIMGNDVQSVDSVDSISIKPYQITQVAAAHWRNSSNNIKEAWKRWAAGLNMSTMPGTFYTLPKDIGGNIEEHVKESLTIEWNEICRQMKNSLVCRHLKNRELVYMFMKDRVPIMKQVYQKLFLTHMMKLTLFGNDFQLLTNVEIINKTKNAVYFHIASKQQMEDLFTVAEKSAVIHYIKNKGRTPSYTCYSCCGKVSTIFKGKRMLGYILAETKDTFLVRLANNKFECIKRPEFHFLEEEKRCIYIYIAT